MILLVEKKHSIYFHLHTKERGYETLLLSLLSSASANSHISTTLDYLVSAYSHITIKLDFNENALIPSTLESMIFNSVFPKDHASFMIIHFKSTLILFWEYYFVFIYFM